MRDADLAVRHDADDLRGEVIACTVIFVEDWIASAYRIHQRSIDAVRPAPQSRRHREKPQAICRYA